MAGCVRRRMTVRTNPPGAQLYVDNYPIGKTPVSFPFTYYGTREVRLVRDGYETQAVKQRFLPPWYQWPVLDFVTENLWPGEIRDERVLDFQLEPQKIVPTDQLLTRAHSLRDGSQVGYISPLPNASQPVPVQPPQMPAAPGVQPLPSPLNRLPAPEPVPAPEAVPVPSQPAPLHRLPPPANVPAP
jgi:hypothetical protein